MVLVLILQLLTLWPLCHTDITSNDLKPRLPKYRPPTTTRLPVYSVSPTSYSKPWLPISSVPSVSYPQVIRRHRPLPPKFIPNPLPPRPISSVPSVSYPKVIRQHRPLPPKFIPNPLPPRPISSVPSVSYPKVIRRHRPLPPRFIQKSQPPKPTSYPKWWPRPPNFPVPSVPYPKLLPPEFSPPIFSSPPIAYPKPSLGAQPAAVVTPGTNVTLTCRAPQPAWRFALFKSGEILSVQYRDVFMELAEFFLEEVTEAQSGSYHCLYRDPGWSSSVWSHPSDTLELLVTDQMPPPSLVALPGPVVAPGDTVSLRCAGHLPNMGFALYRMGEDRPLQYQESPQPWADFPLLGALAPGTYTCYYHTPNVPYVLSQRSEPLVISVEDSGSSDYTTGNLVRLALGGLVLILLATLLGFEWRSWRRGPASV